MFSFKFKSLEEARRILDDVHVENKRYDVNLFLKYMSSDYGLRWLVEYDGKVPVAMCMLKKHPRSHVYINEILAFVSGKGYGAKLLEHVFGKYDKVWLIKNIAADDSLLRYYRKFGFDEFKLLLKKARRWCHVFCKNCDRNDILDAMK